MVLARSWATSALASPLSNEALPHRASAEVWRVAVKAPASSSYREWASRFKLLQHILARRTDSATCSSLHESAEQSATGSFGRLWAC